jgi:hypothetical protein
MIVTVLFYVFINDEYHSLSLQQSLCTILPFTPLSFMLYARKSICSKYHKFNV